MKRIDLARGAALLGLLDSCVGLGVQAERAL